MDTPSEWQSYNFKDYLASPVAKNGYWDQPSQHWYFWPLERVHEDINLQFLVIGSAGVDGIEWGYRKGRDGLWAYYPIQQTFRLLAHTFQELVDGWLSGSLDI